MNIKFVETKIMKLLKKYKIFLIKERKNLAKLLTEMLGISIMKTYYV